MTKTITIRGTGNVKKRPDQIEIPITIKVKKMDYQEAIEISTRYINEIKSSLAFVGIEKNDLKTTSFDASTDYENKKDRLGNYHSVFKGYEVKHCLNLSFDFDNEKLSKVLNVISGLKSRPKFSIRFTIKDKDKVNEELLISAGHNARKTAEILCDSVGAKLGDLVSIDYDWSEINIYSNTRYSYADELEVYRQSAYIDIEPENIDVSDTARFVWEIL